MSITIGFENCEVLEIEDGVVTYLEILGVTDNVSYSIGQGIKYTKTAKALKLHLKLDPTAFQRPSYVSRLLKYQDITSIDLGGVGYRIEWGDEADYYENSHQKIMHLDDDLLIITVQEFDRSGDFDE